MAPEPATPAPQSQAGPAAAQHAAFARHYESVLRNPNATEQEKQVARLYLGIAE